MVAFQFLSLAWDHPLPQHTISTWCSKVAIHQGVQRGLPAQVEPPLPEDHNQNLLVETLRFPFPAWGHTLPPCTISKWITEVASHSVVQRGWAAQVGSLLLLRGSSWKPWSHKRLGQESSNYCLNPEVDWGHRPPSPNTTTKELVIQEYLHTSIYGENGSPRNTDKPQSETITLANTRDNQMEKGKCKNITNRKQGNIAPSEWSSPKTASPGYPTIPEKQNLDSKSHLMMLIEDFKKDINTPLKKYRITWVKRYKPLKRKHKKKCLKTYRRIWGQQIEAHKEEMQKIT